MANEIDLVMQLFDQTDAVIYIKDGDGRYLLLNRRGAELAGVSQEELIGKTAHAIVPQEEADAAAELERQVARTGVPADHEATLTLATGRVKILDHKFPLDLDGHPGAVAGIAIAVAD